MSSLFGRIQEELPTYVIVKKADDQAYEIRRYAAAIAVETSYRSSKAMSNQNGVFSKLATFIGVFKTAENERRWVRFFFFSYSSEPGVRLSHSS